MAKKSKKGLTVGLCVLSLMLGLIIGAGSTVGVETATYDETQNTQNNIKLNNNEHDHTTGVIYDEFQLHFLELGNKYAGDCTYIKAGDTDILIDAGSRADSVATIKNYVDQYCKDGKLEYVIATHAHQDHIAAFVGNKNTSYPGGRDGLLNQYKVDNLIYFSQTKNSSGTLVKNFYSQVDYLTKSGTNCIGADKAYEHGTYILGEDIKMNILYNKYYYEVSPDENNHSVCTLFTYKDHSFFFTGDLEKEGEEHLVEHYTSSSKELTLPTSVDVFKGGHHGSKTSSNECLLELINPKMCCVCCCAGCTEYTSNRVNTFPTQAFIDRIAKYTTEVYITSMWDEEKNTFTSMNGNITVSCNGTDIALAASNNLTKLKDTEWITHKVYVNDKDQIVSKDKATKEVPCRTLPEAWK